MANTIYLDPNQVPQHLRCGYAGRSFTAQITDKVTVPMDAGLWSGGSRDLYHVIRLSDGAMIEAQDHSAAPWDNRRDNVVTLQPGIAVVRHSIFCGKDSGLTFYMVAADVAPMLPAPVADLTAHESIVLNATASYKSSYAGRDRYQMAQDDARYNLHGMTLETYPTRAEWDSAKASLVTRGYLNKAGAITNAGRNALPSRY